MSNIKQIRKEQHLSTEFVARMLIMNEEDYIALEKQDINAIDLELLHRIALLFGVDVRDLGLTNESVLTNNLEPGKVIAVIGHGQAHGGRDLQGVLSLLKLKHILNDKENKKGE